MSEKRKTPYIWVTWITGILAGDDHCAWAAWFKAHNKYDKVERKDGQLTKWKSDHGQMVKQRAEELRKDGYTVYLEDQNKFNLEGKTGITLGGTPDIVAIKGDDALVVDCKSGKRRDKDYFQVCIYMLVLPLTHDACKGRKLRGEIRYSDAPLKVHQDEAEDVRTRIFDQIKRTGGDAEQKRVPSRGGCKFCDISKADCPKRIENLATDIERVTTGEF